jgi:hypothetical protein
MRKLRENQRENRPGDAVSYASKLPMIDEAAFMRTPIRPTVQYANWAALHRNRRSLARPEIVAAFHKFAFAY